MIKYKFWKDWRRVSKLEEKGIRSIETARKIILENIPGRDIIAIYVKGSFVRREMNKHSDVDTSTILKKSKDLRKLKQLEKKYRHQFNPPIQFSGYSIWELKTNKRCKTGNFLRPSPSRAAEHIKHYKIIYGTELRRVDLFSGDNLSRLRGMVKIFYEMFLPNYKSGKFHIHELLKQVFWLVENEQKVIKEKVPHGFKKLTKFVREPNHIIQDTKRLYFSEKKSDKDKKLFIKKLERYLKKLGKLTENSKSL